jgi:hypothetical protein
LSAVTISGPQTSRLAALQEIDHGWVDVGELWSVESLEGHLKETADTICQELAQTWFKDVLQVVRIFVHTVDSLGRAKVEVELGHSPRPHGYWPPGGDFGRQPTHDTTHITAKAYKGKHQDTIYCC